MQNLFVYNVAVDWSTHELLKKGVTVAGTQFVAVLAGSGAEACLIAAQLVGCRQVPTGVPTKKNPNPTVEVMITGTTLLD